MSEEKEVLLGFLIGSISILRDMNIQFTEKSRNKLADKIMELLIAYEKEKEKNRTLKTYKSNLPDNVELICLCKNDFERNISNDYISKDKIKAKIEELKNYKTVLTEPERQILRINTEKFEYGIKLLQSLLEKEE